MAEMGKNLPIFAIFAPQEAKNLLDGGVRQGSKRAAGGSGPGNFGHFFEQKCVKNEKFSAQSAGRGKNEVDGGSGPLRPVQEGKEWGDTPRPNRTLFISNPEVGAGKRFSLGWKRLLSGSIPGGRHFGLIDALQ